MDQYKTSSPMPPYSSTLMSDKHNKNMTKADTGFSGQQRYPHGNSLGTHTLDGTVESEAAMVSPGFSYQQQSPGGASVDALLRPDYGVHYHTPKSRGVMAGRSFGAQQPHSSGPPFKGSAQFGLDAVDHCRDDQLATVGRSCSAQQPHSSGPPFEGSAQFGLDAVDHHRGSERLMAGGRLNALTCVDGGIFHHPVASKAAWNDPSSGNEQHPREVSVDVSTSADHVYRPPESEMTYGSASINYQQQYPDGIASPRFTEWGSIGGIAESVPATAGPGIGYQQQYPAEAAAGAFSPFDYGVDHHTQSGVGMPYLSFGDQQQYPHLPNVFGLGALDVYPAHDLAIAGTGFDSQQQDAHAAVVDERTQPYHDVLHLPPDNAPMWSGPSSILEHHSHGAGVDAPTQTYHLGVHGPRERENVSSPEMTSSEQGAPSTATASIAPETLALDALQDKYMFRPGYEPEGALAQILFNQNDGGYMTVERVLSKSAKDCENVLDRGSMQAFHEMSRDKIGIYIKPRGKNHILVQTWARGSKRIHSRGQLLYSVAKIVDKFLEDPRTAGWPVKEHLFIIGLQPVSKAGWQVIFET